MKNVYLIQPNNALSESLFLPYSTGTIAAFSFSREEIKKEYHLCDFIFTKKPVADVLAEMEAPYIVGFSSYMWNIEYNLALAEAIKKKWKDCVIAFGGPQVPDDTEFLEKYQFIDILMHGEGEYTFYAILSALSGNDSLGGVSCISYRENGVPVQTEKSRHVSVDEFPSPYAMGLFDSIVNDEKYKNIQFDAVLETNRGCPYGCIYCCWAGSEDSFRRFSMERIKDDLLWMAKNRIAFCICADSNFGILERDEEIAEYVVSLKKEYGYPQKFETTAAKNKDDLTFRINSKLDEAGLNRGISVAVQSMSPTVLEIIGRKNMSAENFADQLEKYRRNGMYTYTDIILGLPGETYDSFCKGLFDVIEAGQHYSININRCEFLPNTKMYSESFVKQYKIKTIKSYLCQNHSRIDEDMTYSSRSELVVETSTMSMQDWRNALRISTCVQSFHSLGLLRFFAVYLRKAKNVSYHDFYTGLYSWIEQESVFVKKTLDTVCSSIDTFLAGKGNLCFSDDRIGNIYWDFQEGLFILSVMGIDDFYSEIREYLRRYSADAALLDDLFSFQKESAALPSDTQKMLTTRYDWADYFDHIFDKSYIVPKEKTTQNIFIGKHYDSWEDYARETVWFGKRNGKTIKKTECIHQ